MRRASPILIALAFGALALLPLGMPETQASPGACAPLHAGARGAAQVAQDDGGSGRDAGDARDFALPVPPPAPTPDGNAEVYNWGFLEPAVRRDAADLEDWYALRLAGAGERVMFNVTANYTVPAYVESFTIEAWPPGASAPLASTTSGSGLTASFTNAVPGLWHLRVRHTDVSAGAYAACDGAYPNPEPLTPRLSPRETQNYGYYFGCEPHCILDLA